MLLLQGTPIPISQHVSNAILKGNSENLLEALNRPLPVQPPLWEHSGRSLWPPQWGCSFPSPLRETPYICYPCLLGVRPPFNHGRFIDSAHSHRRLINTLGRATLTKSGRHGQWWTEPTWEVCLPPAYRLSRGGHGSAGLHLFLGPCSIPLAKLIPCGGIEPCHGCGSFGFLFQTLYVWSFLPGPHRLGDGLDTLVRMDVCL